MNPLSLVINSLLDLVTKLAEHVKSLTGHVVALRKQNGDLTTTIHDLQSRFPNEAGLAQTVSDAVNILRDTDAATTALFNNAADLAVLHADTVADALATVTPLPVGTGASTVAAGDDSRFSTTTFSGLVTASGAVTVGTPLGVTGTSAPAVVVTVIAPPAPAPLNGSAVSVDLPMPPHDPLPETAAVPEEAPAHEPLPAAPTAEITVAVPPADPSAPSAAAEPEAAATAQDPPAPAA